MTSETVIEAGDATFQSEVIDRSHELPVVVDFWAPWCGPCRTLGPTIEGIANELDGQVRLVKVNVDESPQVATQFQVSSIPAVKAFKDGRVIAEFVGAIHGVGESGFTQQQLKLLTQPVGRDVVQVMEAAKQELPGSLLDSKPESSPVPDRTKNARGVVYEAPGMQHAD